MRSADAEGSREEIVRRARLRARRRVRRFDMLVALALLLLLIFGWAVCWARSELWPRDVFTAESPPQARSGATLR